LLCKSKHLTTLKISLVCTCYLWSWAPQERSEDSILLQSN